MLPIINSGHFLFRRGTSIYNLLGFLEPGLVVDVGSAHGETVAEALAQSPYSRVVAFEPFPGNLCLLKRRFERHPNVTVISKAVTDATVGKKRFHVPHTAPNGSSTVGLLVDANDKRFPDTIEVDATALCAEVKEHVRLLKIDVQGGEAAVLRGAVALIETHGVDMMLVEFVGQKEIPWRLIRHGYVLFDSRMLLLPMNGVEPNPADWFDLVRGDLSTGSSVYSGWSRNAPRDPVAYCEFMHELRRTVGVVWTDLIAVHHSFMAQFLRAVSTIASA